MHRGGRLLTIGVHLTTGYTFDRGLNAPVHTCSDDALKKKHARLLKGTRVILVRVSSAITRIVDRRGVGVRTGRRVRIGGRHTGRATTAGSHLLNLGGVHGPRHTASCSFLSTPLYPVASSKRKVWGKPWVSLA